jgi:hypothetical protein
LVEGGGPPPPPAQSVAQQQVAPTGEKEPRQHKALSINRLHHMVVMVIGYPPVNTTNNNKLYYIDVPYTQPEAPPRHRISVKCSASMPWVVEGTTLRGGPPLHHNADCARRCSFRLSEALRRLTRPLGRRPYVWATG